MTSIVSGKWWLCLLVIVLGCKGYGDVFSLWSFGKQQHKRHSQAGNGISPTGILNPKRLAGEPIIINGRRSMLGIALVDRPYSECLIMLKPFLKSPTSRKGPNSVLYQLPGSHGNVKRVYLINIGGEYPVIQFSLELPLDTGSRKIGLKHDLPIPGGAVIQNLFEFPNRNSSYAQFSFRGPAKQAAFSIRMDLQADGWIAAGGDDAIACGDFFYKNNPKQIVVFNTKDNSDGSSTGTVYKKKLKK